MGGLRSLHKHKRRAWKKAAAVTALSHPRMEYLYFIEFADGQHRLAMTAGTEMMKLLHQPVVMEWAIAVPSAQTVLKQVRERFDADGKRQLSVGTTSLYFLLTEEDVKYILALGKAERRF